MTSPPVLEQGEQLGSVQGWPWNRRIVPCPGYASLIGDAPDDAGGAPTVRIPVAEPYVRVPPAPACADGDGDAEPFAGPQGDGTWGDYGRVHAPDHPLRCRTRRGRGRDRPDPDGRPRAGAAPRSIHAVRPCGPTMGATESAPLRRHARVRIEQDLQTRIIIVLQPFPRAERHVRDLVQFPVGGA